MIRFLICALIIVGALEWYTVRDGLRHVKFKSEPKTDRVEPGEHFDVSMTIENTGRLPVGYVRAGVRYPEEMHVPVQSQLRGVTSERIVDQQFSLKRKQRLTRTLDVYMQKRGCYRMLGARLYRGDFFGLTETTQLYEEFHEIVVYPERVGSDSLSRAVTGLIGDIVSRRYLLTDPILTMGMRDFVNGDPVRAISWKQTARRGRLTVREFEYTRDEACRIVFLIPDRERVGEELLDICCGLVRSIAELLTQKGVSAVFYTNASQKGVFIDRSYSCTVRLRNIGVLLEALGRIYEIATCRQEQLVNDCVRGIDDRQELILVVPRKTDQAMAAADRLMAMAGRRIITVAGEDWLK